MRLPAKPILTTVQFEEGVVVIQYIDPADLKANGAQRHQTVFVPREDDYDDEIAAIEDAVQYLIADIGEDWNSLKSVDEMKRRAGEGPEADDDEDED
jgi:hypothetical protein